MTATRFVPALELNAAFYREVIAGLLSGHQHAAALLGWGSDVLGYDTERSTDHGWGPRMQIFVAEGSIEAVRQKIATGLPDRFNGWPVIYGWDNAAPQSRVEAIDLGSWLRGQLGLDPRGGLSALDWLLIPQQQLLGVVAGAVYADPDHELASVRKQLAWYPPDVHIWLMACQWQRIGQEIAFAGRAAEVGDELGSRVVAGRLVQDLIHLVFLQNREYRPYSKWLGTAFARLPDSEGLLSILSDAMVAGDYAARESALVRAYEIVAERQNHLGLTEPVDWSIGPYFDRPYSVLHGRFVEACLAEVDDEQLRRLPLVGSVDQFVDSTDVLSAAGRAGKLRSFYRQF